MNPYQSHNAYVIAINGASGAGKTSLVKALAHKLGDATPLFFDDYQPIAVPSSKYPLDFVKWVAAGANPDSWETPQLALDLQRLRRGESIILPGSKGVLLPKRFIVLEEPFGRERATMKNMIDVVIAIDLPLEIALARRLLRTLERAEEYADELFKTMQKFLRDYLLTGREMYRAINERVQKNCDLILDGMKPIDELAEQSAIWIQGQMPT
jgi:uridine kinase